MKEDLDLVLSEKHLNDNLLLNFVVDKKFRIARHLLSLILPVFLSLSGKKWGEYSGFFDHLDWITNVIMVSSLVYINMYILIPRFIYKSKLVDYILMLILTIIAACSLLFVFRTIFLGPFRVLPAVANHNNIGELLLTALYLVPIILFSSILQLFKYWMSDAEKFYQLKRKTIEDELVALRNQIHPHFLFNTLNNINILIHNDPEKASYVIVKLSDFLRYLLYENSNGEVFLRSELKFIEDYLNLEKIRRDKFEYSISYPDQISHSIKIPAHTLLILVENAIKHSIDSEQDSYIDVVLSIENNCIIFRSTNSVPAVAPEVNKSSGLGLNNLNRRLELIYGNSFSLKSKKTKDEYIAVLKLPL